MDSLNVRVLIVAAFATALIGCDSPLDPVERAARIEAASAVDVAGVVGTIATSAPTVRVTDKEGRGVANVEVTFTVIAGSGSVSPLVVTTDADGRASVAWTLGIAVQTNTLQASVGTLAPVVFTAKPVAGPPTALVRVSGDNQIVAVGAVAGLQLKARVTDSFHNPVSGASVSFSIVSGGGTITPATASSDSTGLVSASWKVGPVEGVQSAQAQVAAASVVFTADAFGCPGATDTEPCTGPAELIFVRTVDSQIYRMRVDGTGLAKLTGEGTNSGPAWSPDGKRIAFIRFFSAPQSSDAYIMNADGSNVVRRTTGGQYYTVTWSPDGRSLAVEGASGGDSLNIYTISAEGDVTAPTLLITNGGSPSWSPDGKTIAYTHGTGYYDASQIYVRNADGTGAHRATPDSSGWNWDPAWSPDGKKISFTRCTSGCAVYSMDVTSLAVTLVSGTSNSQDGVWSPDGRWLALTVYANQGPSINYVPAAGGNPRLILSNAFDPSWRPRTP